MKSKLYEVGLFLNFIGGSVCACSFMAFFIKNIAAGLVGIIATIICIVMSRILIGGEI